MMDIAVSSTVTLQDIRVFLLNIIKNNVMTAETSSHPGWHRWSRACTLRARANRSTLRTPTFQTWWPRDHLTCWGTESNLYIDIELNMCCFMFTVLLQISLLSSLPKSSVAVFYWKCVLYCVAFLCYCVFLFYFLNITCFHLHV